MSKEIRSTTGPVARPYSALLGELTELLEQARHAAARSVNAVMTATYWEIGRRIVEFEQGGAKRAEYGQHLLVRIAADLTVRFGRGFSVDNLQRMRSFYAAWGPERISATLSRKSQSSPAASSALGTSPGSSGGKKYATTSSKVLLSDLASVFPLPWSHYARLLSVEDAPARAFYEAEALRGGWSIRQLDRQISTLFYERTALSRDKAAMIRKGGRVRPGERADAGAEIKDPFVLEFLGLKDEYSEGALEEALVHHLESFLLELGHDFTFVARQKRLRVGDEWYRIDLLFYHRRLRCLIVIDLKVGKFTHADAGQMNLYVNYAREHWTQPGENPPIGLILCAEQNHAVAHYALGGLSNRVFASRYKLVLPNPEVLQREIEAERRRLEARFTGPRGRRRDGED